MSEPDKMKVCPRFRLSLDMLSVDGEISDRIMSQEVSWPLENFEFCTSKDVSEIEQQLANAQQAKPNEWELMTNGYDSEAKPDDLVSKNKLFRIVECEWKGETFYALKYGFVLYSGHIPFDTIDLAKVRAQELLQEFVDSLVEQGVTG